MKNLLPASPPIHGVVVGVFILNMQCLGMKGKIVYQIVDVKI